MFIIHTATKAFLERLSKEAEFNLTKEHMDKIISKAEELYNDHLTNLTQVVAVLRALSFFDLGNDKNPAFKKICMDFINVYSQGQHLSVHQQCQIIVSNLNYFQKIVELSWKEAYEKLELPFSEIERAKVELVHQQVLKATEKRSILPMTIKAACIRWVEGEKISLDKISQVFDVTKFTIQKTLNVISSSGIAMPVNEPQVCKKRKNGESGDAAVKKTRADSFVQTTGFFSPQSAANNPPTSSETSSCRISIESLLNPGSPT